MEEARGEGERRKRVDGGRMTAAHTHGGGAVDGAVGGVVGGRSAGWMAAGGVVGGAVGAAWRQWC